MFFSSIYIQPLKKNKKLHTHNIIKKQSLSRKMLNKQKKLQIRDINWNINLKIILRKGIYKKIPIKKAI